MTHKTEYGHVIKASCQKDIILVNTGITTACVVDMVLKSDAF